MYISKVYNLAEFDDQLSLYRELCAYVSNKPNTSTMLDFSSNQEIQDTVERRDFFTNQCLKRLFIDMRDSLGVTEKKDPLKWSDELVKVEIYIHQSVPHDLDITVIGQSFGEFVYEVGTEGNMVNLFEYKIVNDTRDKKLDELAYNYRQSRKRKLTGLDRDIVRQI